jgi:hypothetical protein
LYKRHRYLRLKKNILIYLLLLLFFNYCNTKQNDSSNDKSNIDSSKGKNNSEEAIEVDEVNKFKAFDDIFFGESEEAFKTHTKNYSIANISFILVKRFSPIFVLDKKMGLYEFTLESGKREDYEYCLQEIDLIGSVIEKKYPKATKLVAVPAPKAYGPLMELEMEISKAKNFPPPDDGHLNFIYKWNNDSVTIKAGIRIEYVEKKTFKKVNNNFEDVIEYEKNYVKVLRFSSDKMENYMKNKIKLDDEEKKKTRNEELKKTIKKDVEKF